MKQLPGLVWRQALILGFSRLDRGQKRSPLPPAIITAYITITSFHKRYSAYIRRTVIGFISYIISQSNYWEKMVN
jgi:hypothetical protein